MIKLIHPKTNVIREVAKNNSNKIAILKRAGFVPLEGYKAPKPPKVVAEPSLADAVKGEAVPLPDESEEQKPEVAIHASGPARAMIERDNLDASLITGTGRNGQITKPDVKKYLKSLEEKTAPEKQSAAEDILTHDDAPEPGEAPETAPEDDSEEVE